MNKKVSICITYYNQEAYVRDSLNSVLSIDYPCDYEVLCGDDGSTDGTRDIIQEYMNKYPDKIKYFLWDRTKITEPTNHASLNRLNLAKNATGDYIMFLDGDDFYCDTEFLKDAVGILEKDNTLEACCFNFKYLNTDNSENVIIHGIPTGYMDIKKYISDGIYINAGTFVFRNVLKEKNFELLYKINHFDDNGITIYMLNFGGLYFINRTIHTYRQIPNSIWNSADEWERNLINGLAVNYLSKLSPKLKKQIIKRNFYAIKCLYKNKRNLKNLIGEKYYTYLIIARKSNDKLIENLLNWNSINTFDKAKTVLFWKILKNIAERDNIKQMFNIQSIIDLIRGKKTLKTENITMYESKKIQKKQLQNLRKKIENKEKIRVCYSVVFDSVFPASNIFKMMLKDDIFEPFILVIPDTARGETNMFYQMDKTYKTLSAKYPNVYNSYDYDKKEFIDWSDKMDMCCFANPYDAMTDKLYTTQYISNSCLTFYISYYYFGKLHYDLSFLKTVKLHTFWKIFAENKNSSKLYKKHSNIKRRNICISGYSKMDDYASVKSTSSSKKTIILAPHHTVRRIKDFLNISNFLRLSNFYLELPARYPDVDFVFRPHPLLFITLEAADLWGKDKVKEYIDKINKIPNMIYQDGGDYFQTFADSSALIHDCGSFMAEYLYTGKPQCFILENIRELKKEFLPFGRKILKNCYTAYTEKEIIKFIDDVVLGNNDTMKEKRDKFAQKEIMINYPNATQSIYNNLIEELIQ